MNKYLLIARVAGKLLSKLEQATAKDSPGGSEIVPIETAEMVAESANEILGEARAKFRLRVVEIGDEDA